MDIKHHIETAFKYSIDHITPLIMLTLALAAISFVTFGIYTLTALAGYTDALIKLLRHKRPPEIKDLFSQNHLFFPLLLFTIVLSIITFIGFTLMVVPGIIFPLIIAYIGLYMIPIMVDKKFGLLDAFKKSMSIVTNSNMADHITVFIIFTALSSIGYASFFGFLILQPFATLFLLSVYNKAD